MYFVGENQPLMQPQPGYPPGYQPAGQPGYPPPGQPGYPQPAGPYGAAPPPGGQLPYLLLWLLMSNELVGKVLDQTVCESKEKPTLDVVLSPQLLHKSGIIYLLLSESDHHLNDLTPSNVTSKVQNSPLCLAITLSPPSDSPTPLWPTVDRRDEYVERPIVTFILYFAAVAGIMMMMMWLMIQDSRDRDPLHSWWKHLQ